jgi:HEAT repeat protein
MDVSTAQEGRPAAPEKLVELLVGEDLARTSQRRFVRPTDASRAAEALAGLGDQAVPALASALNSNSPLQRRNAVVVLQRIDTVAALAARLLAARNNDNSVRALALPSLPVFTNREAHQIAWEALADADSTVQNAAIVAYLPIPPARRPSNQNAYEVAQRISRLLEHEQTRYNAAWILGELRSNVAVKPLVAALGDGPIEARTRIIESLALIRDKQATLDLVRLLGDADENVRRYAADALGELGDLRATAALVGALADPQYFVRRDAAAALGKIGDVRAVMPLLPLLEDPEDDVCRSATIALGEIGERDAVPALIAALRRSLDRAEPAAAALGQLRDPRAIPALGQYLEDNPDSEKAALALTKIRHPDAIAELARVGSTVKSLAARRALDRVAGTGMDWSPPETVAQWWKDNREAYLRSLPGPKP